MLHQHLLLVWLLKGSNVTYEDSNIHDFSAADTWIVDTGATHHMTSNVEVLNHLTPYNGDVNITVGNREGLVVQNIGSSILKTKRKSLILHNVLHVPHITMNLLSVKKFCRDNNCWFVCDDLIFFIQDKATRRIVYQGHSDDGELFKIPITVLSRSRVPSIQRCAGFVGKKIKTAVWHKRLGHPTE